MDLWSEIGSLWDQAVDGEPGLAAARATRLSAETSDTAEQSVLLGSRALCEIVGCAYVAATRTALEAAELAAAATGQYADVARYYVGAVRLVAAAMIEPERTGVQMTSPLPQLFDIHEFVSTLPLDHSERLLLAYPAFEASMASGDFAGVATLIPRFRPFLRHDSELSRVVLPLVMLQFARSAAFTGNLAAVSDQAAEVLAMPGIDAHPQLVMLTEALLCYVAGQRADRREVERLSRRVLEAAHVRATYIAVGSCLLVTWAFSAIGQVQRAAALLVTASGGPELPRIKSWDRAFGYELLVTAALRRGDIPAALRWAALCEPLWVATAAVERTRSRVAIAQGEHEDAVTRATASAELDALSGARFEQLRARILHATALASSGERDPAIEMLSEIAAKADAIGATSVRKDAAREWRKLDSAACPIANARSRCSSPKDTPTAASAVPCSSRSVLCRRTCRASSEFSGFRHARPFLPLSASARVQRMRRR
jgi:hypothetical protein